MDAQLETQLIECLSLLEDGEPIDRILARFPGDAASLRAALETAEALTSIRSEPSEQARIASRRAFLNQAAEMRGAARRPSFFTGRLALTLVALVIAFVFAGGTLAASASALPNQTLYPVKRAVEDVQLALASGATRTVLASGFEQRRRDEVRALIANRETASVAFDATIESIQNDRWLVSGFSIRLTPATRLNGKPLVGWQIHIQAQANAGELIASAIDVVPTSGPLPTATPTSTPQPTATRTLRPSATPSPQPTVTETPRPQPTEPPATQRPAPTQAPPAVEIEFAGVVESTGPTWVIGGRRVAVRGDTEIRGPAGVGDLVKVHALRLASGQLIARRIEREDHGGDDQNTNPNGNPTATPGGDDHGGDNSGSNNGGDNGSGDDHSGDSGGDNGGTDDHSGASGDSADDKGGDHADDHSGDSGDSGGHGGK